MSISRSLVGGVNWLVSSSLRDDVRAGGTERAGLQERLDIQFGRMAVLDAKLQSLKDENHKLIGAQAERDSTIAASKQKMHDLEVSPPPVCCLLLCVSDRARGHKECAI